MTSLAAKDPSALANLEKFLFCVVGPAFRDTGAIAPEDFWLILVWKANRAKVMARRRFERAGFSWDGAVAEIARGIAQAENDEGRLRLLMGAPWKFRLPTASAILSVLYPDRFSVYDFRAVETLNAEGPKKLVAIGSLSAADTWPRYQEFLTAVRASGPASASLRQKDHYLWGRSLLMSVEADLEAPIKPQNPRKPRGA